MATVYQATMVTGVTLAAKTRVTGVTLITKMLRAIDLEQDCRTTCSHFI